MNLRQLFSACICLSFGSTLAAQGQSAAADAAAPAQVVPVGYFSPGQTVPDSTWQLVRFDERVPATDYRVVPWQGLTAVEARADASMALLARPLDLQLTQTPVLCWRWWVDAPVAEADMRRKDGDDYAARLYLTFDLPQEQLSLGTRMKLSLARALHGDQVPEAAINYIWDNRQPIGTVQANAYTDRARMLVLRSGTQDTGRWISERRNVLEDLRQLFGSDQARLRQLALASDTDNTATQARALFAELHFTTPAQPCAFTPLP